MECSICYNHCKDLIACDCGFHSCFECFQAYNKIDCANCKKGFLIHDFKPKFARVARAIAEKSYLEDEKLHGLPQTQQWLDYTLQCEAIRKELRYGIRKKLPDKPKIEFSSKLNTMRYFSCPQEECRGFVSSTDAGLRCGSCSKFVCATCREILSTGHVCKKEILDNLQALNNDSKECPKCAVRIFRSAGCNHMFCTHCGTHFDWLSGEVLRSNQSTNGHYRSTQNWSKLNT